MVLCRRIIATKSFSVSCLRRHIAQSVAQNISLVYDDRGTLPYLKCLQLQERTAELLQASADQEPTSAQPPNTILFLEHPHVYTVGRSLRDDPQTAADAERLSKLPGVEFHSTQRGGKITYHGPGMLMVYPILRLRDLNLGVRAYVEALETAAANVCIDFAGIEATPSHLIGQESLQENGAQLTGVWVRDAAAKICAVGIEVRRFVTTHGCALNVNPDLSYFEKIVPCGLVGKSVASFATECTSNFVAPHALRHNGARSELTRAFAEALAKEISARGGRNVSAESIKEPKWESWRAKLNSVKAELHHTEKINA